VTFDEVAEVFGQFVTLDIEPGLDFRGNIFGHVLCPVFEGIEGDDAKRIVELTGDQIADDCFRIGSLDLGFAADASFRADAIHHDINGLIGSIRHEPRHPAWHLSLSNNGTRSNDGTSIEFADPARSSSISGKSPSLGVPTEHSPPRFVARTVAALETTDKFAQARRHLHLLYGQQNSQALAYLLADSPIVFRLKVRVAHRTRSFGALRRQRASGPRGSALGTFLNIAEELKTPFERLQCRIPVDLEFDDRCAISRGEVGCEGQFTLPARLNAAGSRRFSAKHEAVWRSSLGGGCAFE
jgi:hypothetical protein